MSDVPDTHLTAPRSYASPRPGARNWASLPESDLRQLHQHLEDCERVRPPAWTLLAHVLLHKIMSLTPDNEAASPDLAIGGSRVTFSIDGKPPQDGLLVHEARSELESGAIAVASLLGATLIGMRVQQRAPLLNEDGSISGLLVLDVVQPG